MLERTSSGCKRNSTQSIDVSSSGVQYLFHCRNYTQLDPESVRLSRCESVMDLRDELIVETCSRG